MILNKIDDDSKAVKDDNSKDVGRKWDFHRKIW